MTRARNLLSTIQVNAAPPGKLSDGAGLTLEKSATGGKWIWRYSFTGQRREMGLGAWPETTIAAARKARDRWAAILAQGLDPITERTRQRAATRAEMDKRDPTFAEVAQIVFDAKKAGLRGDGERGRWFSPLDRHVLPKIGKKRISAIHQTDIKAALAPIWKTKAPTAEKALQRIKIVLHQGKLMGLGCDPFAADAARHMLGEVRRNVVPIPATPWQDIPALYARLDSRAVSCLALRWMILTCVRSDGARGARFSEIQDDVWTVPADRMKGREGQVRPFRVPLSTAALDVLQACRDQAESDLLFPSYRANKPISDTAIAKMLNTIGEAGRPHGFRTSFRTWVQDTGATSFDVAETVLAHRVGSIVERSYARSDMLEQRRVIMERWGAYVTQTPAQVIQIRR